MSTITTEQIEKLILIVRGLRVILDADLADMYGVTTKHLNQQVRRNTDRFPEDFMFQLSDAEKEKLKFQIGILKEGRGGRRYLPYVFTEHGALMLANILNSPTAVSSSIQVVRAFINLRKILSSHAELARKLDSLERKYDHQFKVVFDAIRELTLIPVQPRKRIGIKHDD